MVYNTSFTDLFQQNRTYCVLAERKLSANFFMPYCVLLFQRRVPQQTLRALLLKLFLEATVLDIMPTVQRWISQTQHALMVCNWMLELVSALIQLLQDILVMFINLSMPNARKIVFCICSLYTLIVNEDPSFKIFIKNDIHLHELAIPLAIKVLINPLNKVS